MATKVPQSGPGQQALDEWRKDPWPTEDRPRYRTAVGEKSLTKQSERDSCDINLIVKRHASTGHVSHINPDAPKFGDFTGATDLKNAIDQVNIANARFAELPVEVRRAAENNPHVLLEMLETDEGQLELQEAGLILTDAPQPPKEIEEQPEPPPTTPKKVVPEAPETATS